LASLVHWRERVGGSRSIDHRGRRKAESKGRRSSFRRAFRDLGGRRTGHLLRLDYFCAGFRSLVEDWSVAPDPIDPSKSVLTQTMGVAFRGALRPLAGVLRWYLQRATRRGALGMAKHFA
jgi:hypothetical protein